MRYYKTEDGKGLIATTEILVGYIEITKEEFDELERSLMRCSSK